MEKPIVICLTPIRNNAWILERFLQATSLWADHIIVADHQSKDGSQEIARRFPKVTLIEYDAEQYNEFHRTQLMVAKAREISGQRLLMAIDVDEFFTGNIFTSPEWQHVLQSPPGTCIRVPWIHPLPGMTHAARELRFQYYVGYMDDGAGFKEESSIHNARLPIPDEYDCIYLNDVQILHYNLVDADRDRSKKRFYMCFELVNNNMSPFTINRSYLHHHVLGDKEPFQKEWIAAYEAKGIDMTSNLRSFKHIDEAPYGKNGTRLAPLFWYDEEVLDLMKKHGAKKFSKLDIWEKDWNVLGKRKFGEQTDFTRKTSLLAKVILRYIRATPNYRKSFITRQFDRIAAWIFNSPLT